FVRSCRRRATRPLRRAALGALRAADGWRARRLASATRITGQVWSDPETWAARPRTWCGHSEKTNIPSSRTTQPKDALSARRQHNPKRKPPVAREQSIGGAPRAPATL